MSWKNILKALETKTDGYSGKKYSVDPTYNGQEKRTELERLAKENPDAMPTDQHGFSHTVMGHQSYGVKGPNGERVSMCLECGVRYFREEDVQKSYGLRKAPYNAPEYSQKVNANNEQHKQKLIGMIEGLAKKYLNKELQAMQRTSPNSRTYMLGTRNTKKFINSLGDLMHDDIENKLKELYGVVSVRISSTREKITFTMK